MKRSCRAQRRAFFSATNVIVCLEESHLSGTALLLYSDFLITLPSEMLQRAWSNGTKAGFLITFPSEMLQRAWSNGKKAGFLITLPSEILQRAWSNGKKEVFLITTPLEMLQRTWSNGKKAGFLITLPSEMLQRAWSNGNILIKNQFHGAMIGTVNIGTDAGVLQTGPKFFGN